MQIAAAEYRYKPMEIIFYQVKRKIRGLVFQTTNPMLHHGKGCQYGKNKNIWTSIFFVENISKNPWFTELASTYVVYKGQNLENVPMSIEFYV